MSTDGIEQIKGSVTRVTGLMSEKETMEAFSDGANKCVAAARELAQMTESPEWEVAVKYLAELARNVRTLRDMKQMSRIEQSMAMNMKMGKAGQGLII